MSTETPDVTEQCCPCSTVRVTTNNVPRDIVDAYELTAAEREDFDYLDWDAIDEGNDSASFIRFKGQLYDLGEFMRPNYPGESDLSGWHGVRTDSYFSALVVKLVGDDQVVIGRMTS